MTEIGARIMPYPAPQEHPADKEGSPTVSARFIDIRRSRSQLTVSMITIDDTFSVTICVTHNVSR
jgi:hypothetical protein